jgi:L-asparaginase II
MGKAEKLVEVWRGPFLECQHSGHAVVCDGSGDIVASWGDPDLIFLPRSSSKMLQALPLIESGAADLMGLKTEHLALACASHQGAEIHTGRVSKWLAALGMDDSYLRCGPQEPSDIDARNGLIRAEESPCQMHNNCSGKHSGFLTVSRHLNAGPEYVDPSHPVQMAVRDAFEDMTGMTSPGYGIDGCSAPNFATSLHGMARAMAKMAAGTTGSDTRNLAAARLVAAMARHPELVAGETRACTEMMRAMGGRASIKTGAEAVFVGILPGPGLGIALKIEDGGTRAAEASIAALLVRLGVADAGDPMIKKRLNPTVRNWRGIETGEIRVTDGLWQGGKPL